MKYVLIAYDLKRPGRNYSELYDKIKSFGDWMHPMESVWVIHVKDETTLKDVREGLKEKMDNNDSILVVDISNAAYSGWLSTSFWEWFKK